MSTATTSFVEIVGYIFASLDWLDYALILYFFLLSSRLWLRSPCWCGAGADLAAGWCNMSKRGGSFVVSHTQAEHCSVVVHGHRRLSARNRGVGWKHSQSWRCDLPAPLALRSSVGAHAISRHSPSSHSKSSIPFILLLLLIVVLLLLYLPKSGKVVFTEKTTIFSWKSTPNSWADLCARSMIYSSDFLLPLFLSLPFDFSAWLEAKRLVDVLRVCVNSVLKTCVFSVLCVLQVGFFYYFKEKTK